MTRIIHWFKIWTADKVLRLGNNSQSIKKKKLMHQQNHISHKITFMSLLHILKDQQYQITSQQTLYIKKKIQTSCVTVNNIVLDK